MSVLRNTVRTLNACEGSILDLMRAVGLDPVTRLEGGDWRDCDFRGLDLRGLSFRNCRLYLAHFEDADVAGADFTGADIHRSTLHKAKNWQAATIDQRQYDTLLKNGGFEHDVAALAARADAGHPLSVWQYVALIKAARSTDEAGVIYDQMIAAAVEPNAHVFTTLMDKAADFALAKTLMKVAEGHGIAPDEAMVNALMSNARSFEEAMGVFEAYAPESGFETTYPFNILIGKAKTRDFALALTVIEMMVSREVRPDHITINAALNTRWASNASKFQQAASLVRESIRWGVDLREEDLAALIRRALSEADIHQALELATAAGVPHGVHIHNAMIAHAPTFGRALGLYQEMMSRDLQPDRHTIYALLTASHTEFEVLEALAKMREAGLAYDAEVVRRAVKKAPDVPRARGLVQQIEASGAGHSEIVRGLAIIWLAGRDTRVWLDRLVPNLRPRKTPKRTARPRTRRPSTELGS